MNKLKHFFFILVTAVVIGLAAQPVHAQDGVALVGTWKMTSVTPDGDTIPWQLALKQESGKWVGTISGEQGDAPVDSLKVDGDKVHLKAPYQGDQYDIDLKLDSGKLVGTWSGNGNSGKTSGERSKS